MEERDRTKEGMIEMKGNPLVGYMRPGEKRQKTV